MAGIVAAIFSLASVKSVLIGAVVSLIVYWLIQKRKYRLPPGPFALPLIGNYKVYTDNFPHKRFFELSKTYGPVLRIKMGPYPWIILNNVDVTLEALVKKGADFADRPKLVSTDLLSKGGKDIAVGRYGPTWKLHRKIAGKALRHYLSGRNLDVTLEKAFSKVIDRIRKEKGPFDPSKYCDFVVFNILCSVCFGTSYDFEDEEFVRIMKLDFSLNENFGSGLIEDLIPYFKDIWPSKRYRKCEEIMNELMDILGAKYKEHKETFNKDNIRDFTDSLILARQEAEDEGDEELLSHLTETHLLFTLFDIFFDFNCTYGYIDGVLSINNPKGSNSLETIYPNDLEIKVTTESTCSAANLDSLFKFNSGGKALHKAGIDTSRMTLTWAILHMAGHQDIQSKVQEELDNAVGRDRFPSIKDRENLAFTEAVLHESMRVNMASPVGVPHCTMCDTQVGGYDIPKGSVVLVNHWALHHDTKYWKDVDKFDPYRYLDSDGKLSAKPESWLPFSAGRRVCLGEPMAKPELHLVFATLLQKFKIKLPPGVTTKFEEMESCFGQLPAKYEIVVEERV